MDDVSKGICGILMKGSVHNSSNKQGKEWDKKSKQNRYLAKHQKPSSERHYSSKKFVNKTIKYNKMKQIRDKENKIKGLSNSKHNKICLIATYNAYKRPTNKEAAP